MVFSNRSSRFAPRSTTGDRPFQSPFKVEHKVIGADRAARAFGAPQFIEHFLVILIEKGGEIGESFPHRLNSYQAIIHAREVGANAGPWPLLRPAYQAGPHRIEADVTNGSPQVGIIHDTGCKAAVEKVTRPAVATVYEIGISPMCFSHASPSQSAFGTRMRWTWFGIKQYVQTRMLAFRICSAKRLR